MMAGSGTMMVVSGLCQWWVMGSSVISVAIASLQIQFSGAWEPVWDRRKTPLGCAVNCVVMCGSRLCVPRLCGRLLGCAEGYAYQQRHFSRDRPANGCGFMVQGAGCRVQGAGCRVQGAGCRVQGSGLNSSLSTVRRHKFGKDSSSSSLQ